MLSAKFDPQSFFQSNDSVALHVPAADVFSLLKRSIDLPPQWTALVGRESGEQHLVPAGGVVEAEGAEDLLFVRLSPPELKFELDSLSSRDGYSLTADVRMRLSAIPDRSELAGFLRNVVGSRRVLQVDGLLAPFKPIIHGAMATYASERDAAELVDATQWHKTGESVAIALQVPLFSSGLTIEHAPTVTISSSMYRSVQKSREVAMARQAEHEAAREVDEALDAARKEHLDHLAGSLTRLKELSAASPGVELPELIRTFSQQQRGELYEALFATDVPAATTRWIVVACGDELLFFDAAHPSEPSRRMRVDGPAGPARSLKQDESGALLVGAAKGIYAWPLDGVSPERTFLFETEVSVRGGFNSVARAGNILAAAHSELGICEWNWSDSTLFPPRFADRTKDAKAVRDVSCFEGDWCCSIDDRVVLWRTDGAGTTQVEVFSGAASTICSVEPAAEGIYAGTSRGDVLFWRRGAGDRPEVVHRGMDRAVESIRMQRFHGVRRLVFADTSPRVHARVIGDSFTIHYEAGGQTLRRVEVAPDLIVATNDLRDRLICWLPSKPSHPSNIINVARLSGRNIQDVCLVAAQGGRTT